MKKGILITTYIFFLIIHCFGQDEYLEYKDKVYVDHIHSVQLYPFSNFTDESQTDANNFVSFLDDFRNNTGNSAISFGSAATTTNSYTVQMEEPIVQLGTSQKLYLSFDDFSDETSNFVYTLQLCNADWTPAELSELDYINGFTEGDIENFDFSYNTLVPYINYNLVLPNNEMQWTKSGNYLLKVYNTDDDRELVLTRRFMVVENANIFITPEFLSATGNFSTHQEINFEIYHKGLTIDQPNREIIAVLRQNRRWDNAIYITKPRYSRNNTIFYTARNKFTFGAGKEFRFLDLMSLEHRRHSVLEIDEKDENFDVTLFPDEPRYDRSYLREPDMNGHFVIGNTDQNGNDYLRSDYADVLFTLKVGQDFENEEVYVAGDFTGWSTDEKYKMVYNHLINAYVAKIKLKQGVYEYVYATVPNSGDQKLNVAAMEGDWYETENDYSILVYYRPFGARYDRLVSLNQFNTIDNNRVNNR